MILYRGSTAEIIKPDIKFSRIKLDFGAGFYTTPLKQQAASWAKRLKKLKRNAILNCYEFDEKVFSKCNIKEFYSL